MTERLATASLRWQDAVPESTRFGDIYFNRAGGAAETEHVFLNANRLPERFAAWRGGRFVIAETGFGTGLNFLCARALWLRHAPADAQLHFISCEKYPLSRADLQRALAAFSQFADGSAQLIAQYPEPVAGFFTLRLDQGRVLLTLLLGDALETLPQLDARVDAWFLDGFAPARNPELWNEQLFAQLARLSAPGTTFATFTAAGVVRRGLQAVGFEVHKCPGFGRKREMIRGQFQPPLARHRPEDQPPADHRPAQQPIWFQRPPASRPRQPVIVIGAGLAGAASARALAEAGLAVRVIERRPEPALEGSGNPQGALYAKLPARPTPHSRFHLAGLHYSASLIRTLQDARPELGQLCGVLQLALHDKEIRRQQRLIEQGHYPDTLVRAVTADEASRLAGHPCPHPGLYFPQAGWVSPRALCHYLLDHPLIECHYGLEVADLLPLDGGWQLLGTPYQAETVVVCCANEVRRFSALASLPLKPIRGQTSRAARPAADPGLATVVCGEGYISPPLAGQYCFGATFNLQDTALDVRDEEHRHNLDTLQRALPQLGAALAQQPLDGRAALRCSSSDYLPLVGPVPDLSAFAAAYAELRRDARWRSDTPPPLLPGLFVNTGHGSKGLISGPISGQLIAALISGAPLPLEAELVQILHPARFAIKNLIRRTL